MARAVFGLTAQRFSAASSAIADITGTALTVFIRFRVLASSQGGADVGMITKFGGGSVDSQYALEYSAFGSGSGHDGTAAALVRSGATTERTQGRSIVADAAWHSAAMVKNGATGASLLLYIDGQLETFTTSTVTLASSTGVLTIGSFPTFGTSNASYEDAVIWSAALTPAEILAVHQGIDPRNIRAGKLEGYWPMRDSAITSNLFQNTYDVSGKGNTLTSGGAPPFQSDARPPARRRRISHLPLIGKVMISQESTETLIAGTAKARLTQESTETLIAGTANARLSQEATEALIAGRAVARISQIAIESLNRASVTRAGLSQASVEVLQPAPLENVPFILSRTIVYPLPGVGSYAAAIAIDSPSAWYRFDESSGTVAVDNSGHGNNGTYEGGFTLGAASLLSTDSNPSVTLNGSTGDVLIAGVPTIPTATSAITLEAWFKTTSSSTQHFIGCRSSTSANQIIALGMSGGFITLIARDNTNLGIVNVAMGDTPFNDGVRHHIVATRDTSKVWRVYVDGVLLFTDVDAFTTGATGFDWAYVGRERRVITSFAGTVDEVAIYNGVTLSVSRIRAHYTAGSGEATTSPSDTYAVAVLGDSPSVYHRLDESSGIRAVDDSTNGSHGARRNGAPVGSTGIVPALSDSAILLNGALHRVDLSDSTLMPTSTSPLSIEAWVKTTSVADTFVIFAARKRNANNGLIRLVMSTTGKLSLVMREDSNAGSVFSTTGVKSINDGVSHHVVATVDTSKNMRLYVDGVLDAGPTAHSMTGGVLSSDRQAIGKDLNDTAPKAWNGTIDEFAIYPSTLSSGQVLNHYNLGYSSTLPFIPSNTVVYGVTITAGAINVPFINSGTFVFSPTLTSPAISVPFIPSSTDMFDIFSVYNDGFGATIPGNGGEQFLLKLAKNGSPVTATLTESITTTSDTLKISSSVGIPTSGSFLFTIDDEVLHVTPAGSLTYRIKDRAMSNTTAASHTAGADVVWNDYYDMAIVSTGDINESFTADITATGTYTYPGWLICFDSTQAYIGSDRYPMHVTSVLGVFDPGVGSTGANRLDSAQPNAVCVPAGISDDCPSALSVPARISTDIVVGDVALVRYQNPESTSILTIGSRSAALNSMFGIKRVSNTNVDVTLTDPTAHAIDGTVHGVWDNPLGPGINPETGAAIADVPYTSVTLPGTDRTFTYGPPHYSDSGWPICALAVRQGRKRIPRWESWDWANYNYVYSGFDTDATFCEITINRNGIVFGSVPEVELPGPQNIDGPDAVWDDGSYKFSASWYVALYAGPYVVLGPVIGGGPSPGGGGPSVGVVPIVTFPPGGPTVHVPPIVEGGSGGGISPPPSPTGSVHLNRIRFRAETPAAGGSGSSAYPFVPYAATYKLNRDIRAGDIITVDMGNSPTCFNAKGYLHPIGGLAFVTPTATPWDDSPFGGETGFSIVSSADPGVFNVAPFSVSQPPDVPFGAFWENTTGFATIGGLRTYRLMYGAPPGVAATFPVFTTPATLADEGSLQFNYIAASNTIFRNYGVGTDSVFFSGGTWHLNLAGSPVPNDGLIGTWFNDVPWYGIAQTIVKAASPGTSVDLDPIGHPTVATTFVDNSNLIEFTAAHDCPAGTALVLNIMMQVAEKPTTDLEFYPKEMYDNSTASGSVGTLVGRAAGSFVGPKYRR